MDDKGHSPFWSNCCKVFSDAEEADLKCILVLLKIDRETRNRVKTVTEFVHVLKERNIIWEGKYDNFIALLRVNDYDLLASDLQECLDNFKKAGVEKTSEGSDLDVCQEHMANKNAVCLTCFVRICFACAFHGHSEHNVTAIENLDDELQEVEAALEMEVTAVEDELNFFRAHINTQQSAIDGTLDNELRTLTESFNEEFSSQVQNLKTLREASALSDQIETERHKSVFKELEVSLHFCGDAVNTVLHESIFSHLEHLNKLKRKVEEHESTLDKCNKHFLESLSKNQCRPVSVSANVANLAHGKVIGAVKVTNLQMILVRNYQDTKNYIQLACLSCDKSRVLFWEQTFEISPNPPLIVMAKTLIVLPRRLMVLVAFGSKLLVVTVHLDKEIHQLFFRSSEMIDLNIPPAAHVTGISAVVGELHHKGIITTDSQSGMFHIFDRDFHLCETLKCTENYQGVTCSLKNEVYKIATTVNSSSVSLLRAHVSSKELTCFCKIEGKFHCGEMLIQSMFFDGSFLCVLWVSKVENMEDGIQYRVVAYDDDDGDEFNVNAEGECAPNVKPISISHIKNQILLCFSDGSVRGFPTADLGAIDLPGARDLVSAMSPNPGDLLGELTRMLMRALEFPQ